MLAQIPIHQNKDDNIYKKYLPIFKINLKKQHEKTS